MNPTTASSVFANWHGGFTARLALSGKRAPQNYILPCPPGREVWIADNSASVHVTCDPSGMFDCVSVEPENGMIAGGMACLLTECFGKLRIEFHSAEDLRHDSP